jgi:hypothetical protein
LDRARTLGRSQAGPAGPAPAVIPALDALPEPGIPSEPGTEQPERREPSDLGAGQGTEFANLPAGAVAVNDGTGVYMTVPSGIGVLQGMDSPQLFSLEGEPLGQITLVGVRDQGGEASLGGLGTTPMCPGSPSWPCGIWPRIPPPARSPSTTWRMSGSRRSSASLAWCGRTST